MTSRTAALLVAAALITAPARAEEAAPLAPPAPPAPPATVPIAAALRIGPNACFDAASLAPVLARWLQRDVIDRRIVVEVTGQPDTPEGLVLRVRRDGQLVGERRFPSLSAPCEEVRAAVGLAAALAVDATVLESLGVKAAPVIAPAPPLEAPPALPLHPRPGFSASLDANGRP